MKKLLFLILMLSPVCVSLAHTGSWQVDWYSSVRMAGTTGEYMPFWARTGKEGILPVRSSGLLTGGADISYRHPSGLFFEGGTNLAGALAQRSPLNPDHVYGIVDRLYISGGWKMLRADVGLFPRRGDLGPLSISGGDIMMSSNARNLPGINLSSDWIYFEKGHWVGIKGNLAHYHMFDDRMVRGTMVHDKSLSLKIALGRKVDIMGGLHHYAQWGGYSQDPSIGQQAQSFRDYIKVFFAKRGDASDSVSDQLNIFGNHLGNEWIRLVWRARAFTMTFQYDKPFEDNSGMIFQNCPDGIWTVQFALNDRKAFVTDITYEFITTMWQSGSLHDRPATEEERNEQDPDDPWYNVIVLGGRDNYFNNSPYKSGWTHYGRTIGLPLFFTQAPSSDGITAGIRNNRLRGHHIGMAGMFAQKVPYVFKATFTENYGTYNSPLPGHPWQLSLALETELTKTLTRLPVTFAIGLYGDIGKLYQNSAGLTFRISYGDFRRF